MNSDIANSPEILYYLVYYAFFFGKFNS